MMNFKIRIDNWCEKFEKAIFTSEKIITKDLENIINEYIVINEEYKLEATDEIKNNLINSNSGFLYFNKDKDKLKLEIDRLFSPAYQSVDLTDYFNTFQKSIIKSFGNEKDIGVVSFEPSDLLYDSGFADWDFVVDLFKQNIHHSKLEEP